MAHDFSPQEMRPPQSLRMIITIITGRLRLHLRDGFLLPPRQTKTVLTLYCVDEVLRLMARNYTIMEELQGHGVIHANETPRSKKTTVHDFVRLRLKPFIVTSAVSAV